MVLYPSVGDETKVVGLRLRDHPTSLKTCDSRTSVTSFGLVTGTIFDSLNLAGQIKNDQLLGLFQYKFI